MAFSIMCRRVGPQPWPDEFLANDIATWEEAVDLAEQVADSYSQNGGFLPKARWFCGETGLHIIWVQPQ